ncbi:Ulp1 protease family protein [Colletotrichum scovillei]|nr:Ulp1 protease family protein [Colletotrichum scovillei]
MTRRILKFPTAHAETTETLSLLEKIVALLEPNQSIPPLTQLPANNSRFLPFRSSRNRQPSPPRAINSSRSGSTSTTSSISSIASASAVSPPASLQLSPSTSPTSSTKSGHKSESRLSMPFRKMARHFGDTLALASPRHRRRCHSTGRCDLMRSQSFIISCIPGRTTAADGQAHALLVSSLLVPGAVGGEAGNGGVLSPQQPYLSFTYEDIKSLKNDWLTDNNIAFWEEWLEREVLPKYPQARIILLRPSMTFLLMKEPDMRQIRSALPDFSKVTHIFLPINDARNVAQAEGGSHWSLLLVSAIDGVAFHYDSLGGANYAEGRLATHKMSEILGRPLRYLNLDDSPQQENGSDCGVFVCILMRHLLIKRLLSANAREKVSMSMANKLIDSHGGRKEMLKIIESLRKEGERRRSRSASPYSSKTPPRIE